MNETEKNEGAGLIKTFVKENPDIAIYQSFTAGLCFSLLSPNGEMVSPLTFCKDFFHLNVFASLRKLDFKAFYFVRHGLPFADTDRMRAVLGHLPHREFGGKTYDEDTRTVARLRFLNAVEESLGFPKSELVFGGKFGELNLWCFEGSSEWFHAPALAGLVPYIIRVGGEYEGGGVIPYLRYIHDHGFSCSYAHTRGDRDYARYAAFFFELLRSRDIKGELFHPERLDNYPEFTVEKLDINNYKIETFQSSGSFVSLCKGYPPKKSGELLTGFWQELLPELRDRHESFLDDSTFEIYHGLAGVNLKKKKKKLTAAG